MDSRRQELAPAIPGHTDPQLTLPVHPVGISADERHAVLNGIAYDRDGRWILGGKNWPLQFLVTLTLN